MALVVLLSITSIFMPNLHTTQTSKQKNSLQTPGSRYRVTEVQRLLDKDLFFIISGSTISSRSNPRKSSQSPPERNRRKLPAPPHRSSMSSSTTTSDPATPGMATTFMGVEWGNRVWGRGGVTEIHIYKINPP